MKKLILLMLVLQMTMYASAQNFFTVSVIQAPLLVANAGPNLTTCFYDSIQIQGVITGGTPPYTISWFPYYGLSAYNIANPTALPDDTTTYTITVIDANNCQSISQMTINIDPCAGIDRNTRELHVNVYPNPASGDMINISIHGFKISDNYKLFIRNMYGQLAYQETINITDYRWIGSLNITGFAKGIYILEVQSSERRKFEKIIIH